MARPGEEGKAWRDQVERLLAAQSSGDTFTQQSAIDAFRDWMDDWLRMKAGAATAAGPGPGAEPPPVAADRPPDER